VILIFFLSSQTKFPKSLTFSALKNLPKSTITPLFFALFHIIYLIKIQILYNIYFMIFNNNISSKYPIPTEFIKENVKSNSWFDISLSNQLITNNIDAYSNTNCGNFTKTNKIEIFPTLQQKKILHQWEHIYTYIYNYTIDYLNSKKEILKSKNSFRNEVLQMCRNKKWINNSKYPNGSITYAVYDAYVAYKTNIDLIKLGQRKFFNLRKKKITNTRKIIKFDKYSFSKKGAINIKTLGLMKSSHDIKNINRTTIYQHNKVSGRYYLFTPVDLVVNNTENSTKKMDFCGIDPGERTFLTGYGISKSNSEVFEIGHDTRSQLRRIKGQMETTKKLKRKRLLYEKYINKINDLHYKSIKFITSKYNNVIIGRMSTSNIVIGNLPKKVNHSILNLAHYKFRERLKYKCNINNINYYDINEAYTSKTCTNCGIINNIGSSKIYKCNSCNITIDRDINGARNILMKYFNTKQT
jgi:putative transposase